MLYDNIGYSNMRISDESIESYISSYANFFPEEIFLHEFLHTLERNSIELDYDTIALHDYEKFGYENNARYGLRNWYSDYVSNNIKNTKDGIRNEIYYTQPISEKNFSKLVDNTQILYNDQNVFSKLNERISKVF